MGQLLLELFSEEIPARMQAPGAAALESEIRRRLSYAGFEDFETKAFSTPRRLTLVVEGLSARQPDRLKERKGPRVGAPDKALEGFLGSVGLAKDNLQTRSDKKGEFYVAVIEEKGLPCADVVASFMPELIREFHWPKSMRWGDGDLRWVRPLHSILCLFDGADVVFEVGGFKSGNVTRGHRYMAHKAFRVTDFADYAAKLKDAKVILDAENRKKIIRDTAHQLADREGFEFVENEALLAENAGLLEWPAVYAGKIDKSFVAPLGEGGLPPEVLTTAMCKHQKYFSLRDRESGQLAPRFIFVSNLEAEDNGELIIAGNERVLRARLSDAKFFWTQDQKIKLEARVSGLEKIIFHADLGSVRAKVARIERLARQIAGLIGADKDQAARAAFLSKADLTTKMVKEFADLQGLMGRYYATLQGEAPEVAQAIEEHYSPLGPSDQCPSSKVSAAVALADKIDSLTGFWAIGIKPTGSKDPYALRRAALGVIRIVLENNLRLNLKKLFEISRGLYDGFGLAKLSPSDISFDFVEDLMGFFADRLKVYLRGEGLRHDLIDAVFSIPGQDDLVVIVHRVKALSNFLESEDGSNLLTAYKRASNILRIEEKNDKTEYRGEANLALFNQAEEHGLRDIIDGAVPQALSLVQSEDFVGAMEAMAQLRGPVDLFFDRVTVNAQDPELRRNRLLLLSAIRSALGTVADFSKIEG